MSKLKVTTISDPDNNNTALTVASDGKVTLAQDTIFNGNVGIGISTPSVELNIKSDSNLYNSTTLGLSPSNVDTVQGGLGVASGGVISVIGNNELRFITSSNERMRIDSSGNLLVGKTAGGSGNVGVQLESNGRSGSTVDNSYTAFFNRLTSDGEIVQFRKDGTTVGSIGSISGDVYLDSDTEGRLHIGGVGKYSWSNSWFTPQNDNARDLGLSAARWKDLYLSGGAYIGGTGSANYLDDYEEGTWTPAFVNGTVTYGNRSGVYTKVGGLVQASFMVSWSAISGLYEPRITLPFNATSSTNYRGTGAVGYMKGVDFGSSVNSSWITSANQGDVNLVLNYDNATPSFGNINDWSSSGEIQCTIVYRTDS